jgi:hypothetical protein
MYRIKVFFLPSRYVNGSGHTCSASHFWDDLFLCTVWIGWIPFFFFFVNGRMLSIWSLAAPNPLNFGLFGWRGPYMCATNSLHIIVFLFCQLWRIVVPHLLSIEKDRQLFSLYGFLFHLVIEREFKTSSLESGSTSLSAWWQACLWTSMYWFDGYKWRTKMSRFPLHTCFMMQQTWITLFSNFLVKLLHY